MRSVQGPEHDAFIAAAKAEAETEFVQMTVAEVAQIFAESSILPPLIAVRKQEPEHFTTFRMVLLPALWLHFCFGYVSTSRTKNRMYVVFQARSSNFFFI